MAEGLLRDMRGDVYEVHSAGTCPSAVHPWAVAAMRDLKIDISGHKSKSIDDLPPGKFDVVITVCDNARQACPAFPGARRRIHWSIPDPAAAAGTRVEIERQFRAVRDLLRDKIKEEL